MGISCAKNRVHTTNSNYDIEHSSNEDESPVMTMQHCLKCHRETTNRQRLPFNRSIPICESCLAKKECQKCHKDSKTLLRSPCKKNCCICCACMTKHMVKPKAATDRYLRCPICNQKMDLPREGLPLAYRVMLIYRVDGDEERASDLPGMNNMYDALKASVDDNMLAIGAVSLPNDDIAVISELIDQTYFHVLLYDSSWNLKSKNSFKSRTNNENRAWSLCHLEDRKIAVSIPNKKQILILSMGNTISEEERIDTRLQYFCLASLSVNELVATGFNEKKRKYYRCTITLNDRMLLCCCAEVADEDNIHDIGPDRVNYIAVNNDKSRVYLSHEARHSVDCCKIRGSKTFFTYKDDGLRSPRGVGVDSNDILYIVGYGSNNLHMVTPAGKPFKIIEHSIPTSPDVIVFNQAKTQFFLSAGWPDKTSALLKIMTTDLLIW